MSHSRPRKATRPRQSKGEKFHDQRGDLDITAGGDQPNTPISSSEATRRRVAHLLDTGLKSAEICKLTGTSKYTVWRVRKRLEAGIGLKKTTSPSPNKILTETFLHDLRVMVEAHWMEDNTANQTQEEMAKILKVSRQTIGNGLKILGLSQNVIVSKSR